MKIAYRSFAVDHSGYGSAARGYIKSLVDLGVEVDVIASSHGEPMRFSEGDGHFFQDLLREESDAPIIIQHVTPELLRYHPGKVSIAYSAWELDRPPEHWVMPLRACDEVWVPSQWVYSVYEEGGVFANEGRVIPHGVDTHFFHPDNTPIPSMESDAFTFGIVADWIERKGGNILIEAFLREFSEEDNVRLAVKGSLAVDQKQASSYIRRRIADTKNKLSYEATSKGKKETFAPIMLFTEVWPIEQIAHFYASLDCYIHPSRGEGWGMGFTEAMASGLPTVGLRGTGNMEFMTDENSFLIDAEFAEVPEDRYLPYQNGIYRAPMQWLDPKVEDVQKMMRHVLEHPEEREKKAQKAREDMVEKWTWKKAAQKMVDRLEEIWE